jgi:outer membrane protein assembly factor BamD
MTKYYLAARHGACRAEAFWLRRACRAEAFWQRRVVVACLLVVVTAVAGCAGNRNLPPPDPAVADQFLMQRGREAMAKKHWIEAREYFREVIDNYSSSPLRPEAKLAMGDSYLGEGSTEALILGANEYREFLTFYPRHPQAETAQYNLAMTYFKQMRKSDRDQTATKEAIREFEVFFQRYPDSPITPEVKEKWRIARDRVSEASFDVGVSYMKRRWYPGAIDRFNEVLRDDPGFSHMDAVYYHLAETLARADRKGEAIPLFDRVVREYTTSEYVEKAQKRLQELKAQ